MRRGKRETERERQELNCSAHLKLHISDAYKLLQPVRIKYAMDNWWALDIKSVLVAHTACLCAHMCVCVCAYNWWGLDRDAGRPPEEIRATLPMSCRLRKKKKLIMHPAWLTVHCTFTCSTTVPELQLRSEIGHWEQNVNEHTLTEAHTACMSVSCPELAPN